jgi:MFS family permease
MGDKVMTMRTEATVHRNRLFVACIISLIATSFGFVVRGFLVGEWATEFNLTQGQVGAIQGAGLFPFAVSIVLFSLFIDRVGYGRCMAFAFFGHVISGIITMTATSFAQLYVGTLLFALANGTVEAVINPVTATLFPKSKTHHLNMLHAGWPGGMVIGGVLLMLMGGFHWKWRIGLYLLPTLLYGYLMLGQKFPVQERVASGVSYADMLREFGWASCFIVSFFVVFAFDTVFGSLGLYTGTISWAAAMGIAAIPTIIFAIVYKSFGRPMFVFLLLVMILLATTELGVDSWITNLMTPVLSRFSQYGGLWLLLYTSLIMAILRFFAGPIVHRISPLGLLATCAAIASVGLFWMSSAGSSAAMIFAAGTMYGIGKTFFWPTTLGVVTEQFPRGGAMTINAIAGVGMISVGVLGGPILGAIQDRALDARLREADPAVHARVAGEPATAYLMRYQPVDRSKVAQLPEPAQKLVEQITTENSQHTLATFAILPAIMFFCYVGLILYFKARGGYRPVVLAPSAATSR